MAVGVLWYAQQAGCQIANALTSVNTTQNVLSQLTTTTGTGSGAAKVDWSGRINSLTVRGGSRDMEAVNTFGINQLAHNKRPEIFSAEFKIIYDKGTAAKYIAGAPITFSQVMTENYGGVTSTSTYTFSRWQYGEKVALSGDRALVCAVFTLDNGGTGAASKKVFISMNNAAMTNRGVSLNAEGYVEEEWTIKCLAQDYYEEDNFET